MDLLETSLNACLTFCDRNVHSTFNRVAFGYEGEDTTISVLSKGSGGLSEVEKFLEDGSVRHIFLSRTRHLLPCW